MEPGASDLHSSRLPSSVELLYLVRKTSTDTPTGLLRRCDVLVGDFTSTVF